MALRIRVLRRSLRMGNRSARISSRLTKPANTKLETHTRRVEISTIMAVEHKWSHTYLDAIIVEFCTQLRLRWRILVWFLHAPRRPGYAGGFSTLDGTIRAERRTMEVREERTNAVEERLTSRTCIRAAYHPFEDHGECSNIDIPWERTGLSKRNVS